MEEISAEPIYFETVNIAKKLEMKGKITTAQRCEIEEIVKNPSYDMPKTGFRFSLSGTITFIACLVSEPIDWGVTIYAWSQGNFSYYDLLGFLPLVNSQLARKTGQGFEAIAKVFRRSSNVLNVAPSILVPKVGHTLRGPNGIVSRSTNGITNARQLIARDIMELRRVYPDIPNTQL